MNNREFNLGSFTAGGLLVAVIFVIIYATLLNPNPDRGSGKTDNKVAVTETEAVMPETESETSATSAKQYNTSIKNFEVKVGDKTLKFTTPKDSYSLTDQYLDQISQYYNLSDTIKSDSMIVVGDGETQNSASILLNANKLSDIPNLLKQLYGDDFDADKVKDAEAYTYMKTGKIPDDHPDNYKIKEAGEWEVDGVKWKAYDVSFDTTYDTSSDKDNTESTENNKTTIHTEEICAYTDTKDDGIEIIINQQTFNKKKALKYLKEFIGVKG